jgi:hypothetical protein
MTTLNEKFNEEKDKALWPDKLLMMLKTTASLNETALKTLQATQKISGEKEMGSAVEEALIRMAKDGHIKPRGLPENSKQNEGK